MSWSFMVIQRHGCAQQTVSEDSAPVADTGFSLFVDMNKMPEPVRLGTDPAYNNYGLSTDFTIHTPTVTRLTYPTGIRYTHVIQLC
jgi:hypothetical protein